MVIGKSEVYFLMKTAYVLDSNKTYISAKQVADNYQLQPNETFYEPDTSAFPPYHLEGTKGVGIDYETFLTKNNIKIGDWYPELGVVGPKGPKGDPGPASTFKGGTVTVLPSDTTPTAEVIGKDGVYTINFGIPQGFVPVKGKDYWTDDDKKAILDECEKYINDKIDDAYAKAKSDVEDAILNGKW